MKAKELLNEWKQFLNENVLNEISIKRFQEQYPQFDTSKFNSQMKGNTDYLDIISNSISAGQNHGPDDYIQQFEFYKNSIEPNRNSQEFLAIQIPGDEPISLEGKVNQGACTATYDDIQQFQQARLYVLGKGSKSKLNDAYRTVIDEANESDFEKVAEDSNWIIYYPKSLKGSIALARSYWDGSKVQYDNTFNPSRGSGQNTGKINWCTSVSGPGNMFLNYHRRLNLHMYYCIKKNTSNLEDKNRKLCVSFSKSNNKVEFKAGSASVNGNNDPINAEEAKSLLGSLFNELISDAVQDSRLEIDEKSYYKSISLEQYIVMRNANEENIRDFIPELGFILRYSKDADKIINYCINDSRFEIRKEIARSGRLSRQQIEDLADDSDENIRVIIATRSDLPESLFLKFVSDTSSKVRSYISANRHASSEILEELSNDTSEEVAKAIGAHPKASESALLNIINRHKSSKITMLRAINNRNLSDESFRKLFNNKDILPSIKADFIPRGIRNKIISKQEILDLYNKIKNLGQMSFDIADNFGYSEIEEIYLDIIDFCKKNSKGNKIAISKVFKTILSSRRSNGTTESVINKIYNLSKDSGVICFIATNRNTPDYILKDLLLNSKQKRGGKQIRADMALNLGAPIDILEELSYDEETRVRYNVASNPNVSINILERLSKDKSRKVSRLALSKLEEKRKTESTLRKYIKLVLS